MVEFEEVTPEYLSLTSGQTYSSEPAAPKAPPDPLKSELEALKANGTPFPQAVKAIEKAEEITDKARAVELAKEIYNIT